jgi:hypothetical protein
MQRPGSILVVAAVAAAVLSSLHAEGSVPATPVSTAFTYQGQLRSGGFPETGSCDFVFNAWDSAAAGVHGYSNSSYAGYFQGSLYVSGSFVNPFDATLKVSVAQQLEKVLPDLVVGGCEAGSTLAVDYVGLVPVLMKALQEEHTLLEKKSGEIEELQKRRAALEALVDRH